MADKATLRRLARLLSPATDAESDRVAEAVTPLIAHHRTVCLYLPIQGEVDLTPLIDRLTEHHWVTTRTAGAGSLTIHAASSDRERHPFGYDQPVDGSPEISAADIDVFLVPALAFDESGRRLGHGAGYYDRLLVRAAPTARFVGVSLERRVFPAIPAEAHDVTMHVIVTEDRVIDP